MQEAAESKVAYGVLRANLQAEVSAAPSACFCACVLPACASLCASLPPCAASTPSTPSIPSEPPRLQADRSRQELLQAAAQRDRLELQAQAAAEVIRAI